MKVLDINI